MTYRTEAERAADLNTKFGDDTRTLDERFKELRKLCGTFDTTTEAKYAADRSAAETEIYWAGANNRELSLTIGMVYALWYQAKEAQASQMFMNDECDWHSMRVRQAAAWKRAYGTKANRALYSRAY